MATFTWKNAKTSGLWTEGANWVGGVAPNSATDLGALNAAGPYSVTIPAGSTVTAQGVSTVAGVTLDVAGTFVATVPGAFLTLSGAGLLDVNGTLHANGTGTYIFLNNLALANLSGGVLSGGTFAATGQPNGGSVATIDVRRTGQDSSITTLDATVVLRHVNSTIQARDAGGTARTIDTTLTSIAPGGELHLLGGRGLAINQALSVSGRLVLEGSKVSSKAGLSVASGGTVEGSGTISTAVALAGTVRASGGTLALSGGATGAGTLAIDSLATLVLPAGTYDASLAGPGVLRANAGVVTLSGPVSGAPVLQVAAGATIDLGGAGAATLAFAGSGAKLAFDAAGFSGSIVGFQTGNVLQVKDILATGASIAPSGDDSLLTLTTAGGSVSFKLSGDYSAKTATVAPDGSGGTEVTVAGVSFVPEAATWGSSTITWSLAKTNFFGSLVSFSSFVDEAAQADVAAMWRTAFARWAEVSGLTFVELPDATGFETQADIRVGWGNFGDPPATKIGEASFSFIGGTSRFVPGTLVRLQDPAITPLVDDAGTLVYQGSVSSAYQIMLHEIGHALGLDHTAAGVDPEAAMNPQAGADNRDLDISDIAGIRAIYAGRIAAVVAPATTLSIAALSATKPEGGSGTTGYTFTVSRSGDTAGAHTASYAVSGSGGAPASAADFAGAVLPSGTISFAPGQTSQVLTIAVAGDTAIEVDEGFTVTLAAPSGGASLGTATAAGSIVNDDATLSIAALSATKPEGDAGSTGFTFTVTRAGRSDIAASATWTVTGSGAAPAGAGDFTGAALPTGSVSFAPGQTTQTVTVPVAGDSTVETDEGFSVTLSAPSGATIAGGPATGAIVNDDTAFSIAALEAVRLEGQAGSTGYSFTITRTGDTSDGGDSVAWAVAGSGATPANGADFAGGVLPGGIASFAPGQTSLAISVPVLGDSAVEPDEGFSVTLSSPVGGALGTAIAAGSILNDDAEPGILALSPASLSKAEGHGGTTSLSFTVSRESGSAGAGSADWAVTGAGANPASAADFAGGVLPSGTVSFADGQTSATITVAVAGDTAIEADEGFAVTLSNPAGVQIGAATAAATILNDDATLAIAALDADRAEGQSGTTGFTFTVTRAGDTSAAHSVAYAVGGASGTDFAGGVLPAGTLSFAPGQTAQTLTIPVAGDTAIEADDGFTVTLSAPSAGATLAGASAAGTIRTDDAALSIAALVATRPEGDAGSTGFSFTVTRSGFTASGASVDWAVSGADAADFHGGTRPFGTLSFAPGETSRMLTIDVAGDGAVEPDEGFTVTLSNPAGATLAAATAAGVILNDDATIAIAATAATVMEGNGGSTGVSFTLTRAGNTAGPATVAYAVAGTGANPADAADFAPAALPAGTVSFAPGETSRALVLPVAGDGLVEPDEGFAVTLSAPTGATLGTATASATILNDDVLLPATLSLSRLVAIRSEGQSGATDFTFLVTRSGDTATEVSAAWTTAGGGAGGTLAATGPDFVGGALPSGIVTLAPGQTSAVITIPVAGDTTSEANDSFTVTLASASPGSSLASANAVGIIYNDDSAGTGTLSIARASASKPEGAAGATPFSFTVTRSGATTGSASADWSLTPGGIGGIAAIDTADLVGGALPSGRVAFAPGETSKTVTVNIAGDGAVEPDESFTVTLSGAQAGVGIATASATGLVQNDDVPGTGTLAIARLHAARAEGQSGTTAFTFLVSRGGDLSGPARASWAVTGGAIAGTVAAGAADFAGSTLPSGSVSFAAGQASQAITVTVAADSLVELNESFTVTLSAPAPGVVIATPTATGLIFNDDTAGTGTLSVARASAQKSEGHAGTTPFTFTVTRSGDASGSASADWAVAGGGAPATVSANAADFPGGVLPNGRVNFAAGQTSQTVTVNVAGDGLIELNDSFTITLAAPQAGVALGTASATGVILNDDFPPSGTLSVAGLHAARGEGAGGATAFTFAVTRTGSSAGPASAAWSITGGGVGGTVGTAAADFVGGALPSGTVSLAPGQTSAVIAVEIAGDTAIELNESFTVTLSAPPAGVSLGTASAAGLVWNDDPAGTGTLSLAADSARLAEGHDGSTALTFVVTRSGDTSGAAGADWTATGGGAGGTVAATGADLLGGQLPAGRVQFADGQSTQVITLNVAGDTAAELNESVTVTLLAPQPGVALATVSAVGIILNDDHASTAANQALTGTDAADLFLLGGGLDTVTGRAGTDLFLFQPAALGPAAGNAATLADFSSTAGEVLNLAAIDANGTTPGDDPFVFIGIAAFSGAPGELRWEDQGSQRMIQGNTAGDTSAELTIFLKAAGPVEAGWFVL